MTNGVRCEFFVIRYVPDVVKGEFVNIGVVLRETESLEKRVAVRFTRDWRRVRCLDTSADVEMLESLEGELAQRLSGDQTGTRPLLESLGESLSNSVQMTEGRACLAETMAAEIDQLMRMYVERQAEARERRLRGRAAIAGRMRREFERAGVWGLLRKRIAVAGYTRAGDPLKIDCGYRPNGLVRMFQAVSLQGDLEAATVLAYSLPALMDGVRRLDGAALEMTAVVEPLRLLKDDEETGERYRFGVETMEQARVRVMTTTDLPRIAETARIELRV